jgi:radical SAM superfamily enzyme YgiQ (UPF0313 family)
MYVAAYLEKYTSHQVKILDCLIEKLDYEQLKTRLMEEKPDLVGITALTFNLIDVLQTAKTAKEINSNIKIVLGGAHVNIYPKETINFPEVDFLVLGEGEKPMKDLVDNLNQIKNLYNVKGLIFRDGNKIINTGPRELIQDLDSLPFPARNLIPYKKYFSALSKVGPVTTMFTSRGCPYRCLFCNRAHLGKIFRARSAKNVVDEMEECQKMGIKEIFIYDDTFTVDKQRVLDVCAEIKKRNLKINWDIRARVDTVDEETLKAMKETGCQRIHYGVEAGTQKILNVLRKGITLKQVEKAFRLTKKIGIQALAFFMLGSPQETKEDVFQTIKFAKKLKPDFVIFSVTTPYPLTDLYSLGLKEKILSYDYWQEFAQNPKPDFVPPIWEKELSREELFSLSKKAYRSFYRRPAYVVKSFFQLFQLRSFKELMTKVKAALNILKV